MTDSESWERRASMRAGWRTAGRRLAPERAAKASGAFWMKMTSAAWAQRRTDTQQAGLSVARQARAERLRAAPAPQVPRALGCSGRACRRRGPRRAGGVAAAWCAGRRRPGHGRGRCRDERPEPHAGRLLRRAGFLGRGRASSSAKAVGCACRATARRCGTRTPARPATGPWHPVT